MSAQPSTRARCTLLCLLAAAILCVASVAQAAESELIAPTLTQDHESSQLQRVRNLVRANVLGLAREILERESPSLQPDDAWLAWERQLWSVYREQRDWAQLHRRALAVPSSFPIAIRREAALQAIDALNELNRGADARALIRSELVVDVLADDDSSHLRHFRRLREALIESYLNDDLIVDAQIALHQLRRDYGARGIDSALLYAGVLLRGGDADGAINLLAPLAQPPAQLLRLYARLRNQTVTPAQAIERADALLPALKTPAQRRNLRAVIAQAHLAADDAAAQVEALEAYLSLAESESKSESASTRGVYPRFTPSDLLAAYRALAQREANAAGWLVGDEAQWLDAALALPSEKATARRALFAHVTSIQNVESVANDALRSQASDAYIDALIDADLIELIAQMFGVDAPLGELALGGAVGVRLSAHAVARGDLALAADANARIDALPSELARADWLLSAARIDVHAGHHQRGAMRLHEWLESFARLTPQQADAVLQVVFDLQTSARHRLALELLHAIDARAPAGKHRREIAYWLGESYHAEAQYLRAADSFLHSALQQANDFDRWGLAARYRAAESLASAQLFDDAAQLFADLLARSDDDARRGALQRRLQQLRLQQSAPQAQ